MGVRAGSKGTGVCRGALFPSCPVESMAKSLLVVGSVVGLVSVRKELRKRERESC